MYVMYQYNTPLFVNLFCENKDRPQMNCNGQCQLGKMQKEEEKKAIANIFKQLQADIFYVKNMHTIIHVPTNIIFPSKHTYNYFQLNNYICNWKFILIKPPEAIG